MQYSLKSLQRALAHTLDRPLHGIDLLRPYCNDRVCGSNTDQKLRYAKTGEQIILQSMSSARIADAAAAAAAESPLPTAKKNRMTLLDLWKSSVSVVRYDTRCYFNVRSKADMSRLNLPHGDANDN